jgi:hypothetical protein
VTAAPLPPAAERAAAPKDNDQPAASPPAPAPRPRETLREPTPKPPTDFRSKFRDDWRAIRRGLETAPDDFKNALDRMRGRAE